MGGKRGRDALGQWLKHLKGSTPSFSKKPKKSPKTWSQGEEAKNNQPSVGSGMSSHVWARGSPSVLLSRGRGRWWIICPFHYFSEEFYTWYNTPQRANSCWLQASVLPLPGNVFALSDKAFYLFIFSPVPKDFGGVWKRIRKGEQLLKQHSGKRQASIFIPSGRGW